jgi:hypothetical protein
MTLVCNEYYKTDSNKEFLSSGLLRSIRWFKTDVLALPISPIFKGKAVQEVLEVLLLVQLDPRKWDQ